MTLDLEFSLFVTFLKLDAMVISLELDKYIALKLHRKPMQLLENSVGKNLINKKVFLTSFLNPLLALAACLINGSALAQAEPKEASEQTRQADATVLETAVL